MKKERIETNIYRLEDGRLWVRATAKDPVTDKVVRREATLDEGATLRDARRRVDELKNTIWNRRDETTPEWKTVRAYAMHWDSTKSGKSYATRVKYQRVLEVRILPLLGDVEIEGLTRGHLQDWVAKVDAMTKDDGAPYARQSRLGWWAVCKQLMLDLKADCGIGFNPVERVKPPKKGSGANGVHWCRKTLTLAELDRLLEVAKLTNRWAEIAVLATTGMRVGELYGLKWCDIDHDRGVISISRSASKGVLGSSTKTGGVRDVPLQAMAADALREHRKAMMKDDHPGLVSDLVFPSDAATVRFGSSIRKPLRLMSEAAELEFNVTPQVMRRTFNTLCLQAGVSQIVIRSMMGHSSDAMTELYAGVQLGAKSAALGAVFGEPKSTAT